MPSANVTSKLPSIPTQSFSYLREKGLQYVQQLSGKLWTDHNLHDPGVTILEVLCYALMDLGYRSNFDMRDLITEKDGTATSDSFYTAGQIFTTHPVTINDYRKLLIDIPGVRNAWLFASDSQQKPFSEGINIYAYCKKETLVYESEIPTVVEVNDRAHVKNDEGVFIRGLYSVKLELDEHPLYGDLNSSVVSLKIVTGELAGYLLELRFPDWSSTDKNKLELASMFKAAAIDTVKVDLLNDTKLDAAKFLEVKRSQFSGIFTIGYDSKERILDNVTIRVIKSPAAANGLVKADSLQKGLNENTGAYAKEALKRYRQRPAEIFKTFDVIRKKLMSCRNLCEDFLFDMGMVDTEDLVVCLDVDVEPSVDLETVLAEAFSLIENYLLPPVQFSTLKDLLDKNVPVDEIFNGPTLDHGFLTDEAIRTADIQSEYYSSDIINLLMDIKGVLNIRNFQFTVYGEDNKKKTQREDWRIIVSPNHKLRLNRERSKFLFYKNGLPLNASFLEAVNKLRLTQTLQINLKYKNPATDLPVPTGKYRKLDKHYSILNEFPRVYGLGEKDLPDNVSTERKAQVKQLEAYLTFFDQLLANFFGGLNNLKELLSWKTGQFKTLTSSWFYTDKDASQLFEDYNFLKSKINDAYLQKTGIVDNAENKTRRSFLKTQTGLQHLTETYTQYLDRRNRLLDHLISRFAESFSDYAINMYALPDEMVLSDDAVSEKQIDDKVKLLQNYPALSGRRSGGYNYAVTDNDPLGTTNLSGYARRMRSLLGMEINKSKPLQNLADDDFGGFHLVEHLLLRPVKEGNKFLSVCLDANCDHCGEEDPYSFKVSIVLPFWPKRFESMHFRNYMETLFRSEAPAHVFLKICWVDKTEMAAFETAYAKWVKAKAVYYSLQPAPDNAAKTVYSEALKEIIEALESLRTDFPAATLHDCSDKDEENDTRVFLNHTALGEFKNIVENDPG